MPRLWLLVFAACRGDDGANGQVLRGAGLDDDQVHLLGFTQALDGTVIASIDGVPTGDPVIHPYDAPHMAWDLLGAGFSTGNRAECTLGLLVVVPSVLSPEALDKLAVFARKWGIGATPSAPCP
jgi:hypothetical protein